MVVEVRPTQNPDILAENIRKRVKSLEIDSGVLKVEVEDASFLKKVPGVEEYIVNGEAKKGLGGRPLEEEAYARLDSKKDAVKCFLATIRGYKLRVLNTDREWDLRQLRKYNPEIKHLKSDEPIEFLNIKKSLCDLQNTTKVDIQLPAEKDVNEIYRKMLT